MPQSQQLAWKAQSAALPQPRHPKTLDEAAQDQQQQVLASLRANAGIVGHDGNWDLQPAALCPVPRADHDILHIG